MKKILTLCLAAVLLTAGMIAFTACGGGNDTSSNSNISDISWPAMDTLNEIKAEDVSSVEFARATEGGSGIESTEDLTQIEDIILRLKEVEIKGESKAGVDDNDLAVKIVAGDKSPSFTFEGDILVLEDGSRYEVENLESLRTYIDKLLEEAGGFADTGQTASGDAGSAGTEGASGTSGGSSASGNAPDAGSSDYNVSKGFTKKASSDGSIEYLYFNDFMITMPNNDKWSFEMNGNSVSFYLFSAQQEGNGGRLVTVKAYDIDDNSYEQLPVPYQVAGVGKNVNKRFIAIYPSDVQYNPGDATQAADYKDLYDYLKKIGEGAVNSPLQTQDSD